VDLLSDDVGYVRVFAEMEGYSYEVSTYHRHSIADLFEQMCGYDSIGAAREAARFQLLSAGRPVKRARRSRPRIGSRTRKDSRRGLTRLP
jgi:hypothetical protein